MPDQKITNLEATPSHESKTVANFIKMFGSPAYWVKPKLMESFDKDRSSGGEFPVKSDIKTGYDQ